MAIKKNDRIKVTFEGAERHGFVTKVGAKVRFVLDDGRRLAGSATALRPSDQPISAGSPFADAYFKKGARVSFEMGSEVMVGTIISATVVEAKVAIDGGKYEPVTLLKSEMKHSDVPAPANVPSPMDRWSVRKYKPVREMSEETTAFTAELCLDGKPVIHARNTGTGGCNLYININGAHGSLVSTLDLDAMHWSKANGGDVEPGLADVWLIWETEFKPTGMLAKDFLAEFNKPSIGMDM